MKKEHIHLNKITPHQPSVTAASFFENFLSIQQGPACIKMPEKNTQLGKYAFCNEVIASRDGISVQDYIGLTAYDVAEKLNYDTSLVTNVIDIDSKIFSGLLPHAQYKQNTPTDEGLFSIEEIVKKPILDKNSKVIGLFSYGNDITSRVNPLYLFSQYQRQYSEKEAVQYFLGHMQIQPFFYTLPTIKEISMLLIMLKSRNIKYVSAEMSLDLKVVKDHKARLKNNLKSITLDDLVIKLRMRNERTLEDIIIY